jgi:hypothetical protein
MWSTVSACRVKKAGLRQGIAESEPIRMVLVCVARAESRVQDSNQGAEGYDGFFFSPSPAG